MAKQKEKVKLASILKEIGTNKQEKPKEKPDLTKVASSTEKEKTKSKSNKNNSLTDLFLEIRGRDYQNNEVVRIDKDIHSVFTLLKKHTKVNIGDLLSFLGEQFIHDNLSEVKEIINKKNKFLK